MIDPITMAHVGAALAATALVGMFLRGRVAACWSFFAYLLVGVAANRLVVHFPERFFEFTFWSSKETVLHVLKILVAVEIWHRTFSSFPRARVRVGLALAGGLLAIAVAVRTLPTDLLLYDTLVGVLFPRQQAGVLMLFAVVVSAIGWHRVPLHPHHRAILVGFGACLPLSTFIASFIGFQSSELWQLRLRPFEQLAFVAASDWWAWTAWRPRVAPSPIVSRLQPWAHSW